MHKETITYTDYNGLERTEDFYFNLTEAEIIEMQYGTSGGFAEMVQRIIAAQDMPSIIAIFKDLVLRSYGKKSPDGRKFEKTEELKNDFVQTPAYSKIFMKYATDSEAGAAFVNNIIPAEAAKQLAEQNAKNGKGKKAIATE